MWLKKIFICDKLIYISEQMFIFYQEAYMYEDINRKIIESAFGNVEKYMEMQTNIANMSQSITPVYEVQRKSIIDNMPYNIQSMGERISEVVQIFDRTWVNYTENILSNIAEPLELFIEKLKFINDSADIITHTIGNYVLLDFSNDEYFEEDTGEEEINAKIVEEIFKPDQEKQSNKEESTIITLSPVNDRVLKYLSENPQAFYQLTGTEFEIVMTEIYNKLGYKVERTQSTRDGGKDIIIRKPEILGDFIYYVECKKYAANRHIGIGIIGTINTDRVNGGILATTSYFTRDARKFISENNYSCQIQMHDYEFIRGLLDQVV